MLEIMKGEMLFVVLLGILLFVSAIQSVELIKLNELVKTGEAVALSDTKNAGAGVPDNLKNIPSMVGGC